MGSQDQHRETEPQKTAETPAIAAEQARQDAEERRRQLREKARQDAVAIEAHRRALRARWTPGGASIDPGDAA